MPKKSRHAFFLSAALVCAIASGPAAQEDFLTWPNAQKVVINTSSSGANTTGTVYGFPLLIRLNPSNFAGFSSTLAQGADVRFAKPDNTPLPYEIERWIDGANNNDTAELWVRVDTVRANNSTQYIMMYWGKSGVSSRSHGQTVFDTANGFAAVYHLKEKSGNIYDATFNPRDGERLGSVIQIPGAAGYGQAFFGGSGNYVKTSAAFDKCSFADVFTASAWVHLLSTVPSPGALWAKASDDLTWSAREVQFFLGNSGTDTLQQGRYPQFVVNTQNWINSSVAMGVDAWHHVTFVYNKSTTLRQIYINGQSVALANASYVGDYDNAGNFLFIGRDICGEVMNDFNGGMDELRISKIARGADWIKLCYENQKANQNVVSFEVIDSENYATWTASQRIYLNTSPSGANVTGNVYEFPVLIRLDPSLFKGFPQVQPGGADIRFAKSNGEHLSYEIERWVDGPNSSDTTELWVKVDTVFGNNSQQYITMYWGKGGAASRSNGASVFSTGNNFQGVWHLNENPGGGAGAMKDRTVNGSHGTAQNNLLADDGTTGLIGRCLNFDGPNAAGGDWLRLPNATALDNTGNMIISCWFRMANGASATYYGIAGKYAHTGSNYSGYSLCRADNRYLRFNVGNGNAVSYIASDNAVTDNAWHHVAGAVYNGNLFMFVDGRQQGAVTAGTPAANQNYGALGRLDGYQDYRYFVGDIDEVRVSRMARSSNWIRLCYENQRADQKLVSMVTIDNENYVTWPYSQNLCFNTSATGAYVRGTVYKFPVLVRLHSGVFKNFHQTLPGGADIRFAKADGSHCFYEIERWVDGPANNDTAEIWVRVDTVYGNSTTQYLTMYWGKSGVASMSHSPGVFDAGTGFSAVWHFPAVVNDTFRDATLGDHRLVNYGTVDSGAAGGIIGRPRCWDPANGDDSLRYTGLCGSPAAVTLSVWAKAHANPDVSGMELVSLGDHATMRLTGTYFEGCYREENGWPSTVANGNFLGAGWHHFAYVTAPAEGRQVLYVDGREVAGGTSSTAIDWSGLGSSTLIGKHGYGQEDRTYDGCMDEVRIDYLPRTADWIKLSYENQKANQTFVSLAEIDNENYATWSYSQKVYLNTSAGGANVSETVVDFPVLIRLTPALFSGFPQTQPGGADIRFAASNGTHVAYEIERWVDGNTNCDTAEIWVRVDTLYGNNSSQFILMYWGKSGVISKSNGNAVFRTNNAFQGVWHLNESPVGANSIKDRTVNGNHGSPQNRLTSTDLVNGVIGKSINFDGPATVGGDYIRIPNSVTLDNAGNMSISCWFRLTNSGSTDYYGIAGKFRDSAPNYYGYLIGRATTQRVRFGVGNGSSNANMFVESNGTVIDNNWHHAVGIVTSGTLNLYLDGVRQSATATGTPVSTGDYAVIGRRAGNLDNGYFMGDIDEVRFSNAARSAGWIKLCFENQKSNQTLVAFTTGDTEDYATWPYSQKVYINTTNNGAQVTGTVTGFPLLLRLNPSTFEGFAATLADGADIRFASSSGAHLPYEIERWIDGNGNNDTAEVWIRIDTIRGNTSSQYIVMHWGKSGSSSRSSSREVFDITRGFVAAYHLGESSGNALDATANSLHAVPRGALPSRSGAVAGYGGSFNGGASYYNAGNDARFGMSTGTTMTLSAWVNRKGSNAIRTQYEGIAGKYRWASANAREYALTVDTTRNAGFNFMVSSDGMQATLTTVNSRIIPQNGSWYHVAGTLDGSLMRIYVNGAQQASSSKSTIFSSLNADFRIGIFDSQSTTNIQSWNGQIDEVVLSRVARSPDWIKLAYETQKPGQSSSVIPEQIASPVIRSETPADVIVTEGTSVTMVTSATGCRPFSFRWYKDNVRERDSVPGQNDSILRFPSAQIADTGRYLCVVSNPYGKDTSRPALLTVEPNRQITNPLIVQGAFIDSTHVRLSISRYSSLPESPTPPFPWSADSVWIWYKANEFPSAPLRDDPNLLKFPLSTFRKNTTDQYDTVVTIRNYPTTTCYYYYFLGSVYWNNIIAEVDSIPPFADPSASGTMVYMCDTSSLSNPLRFSFNYRQQTDSVAVTLSNITQLEWNLVASVRVSYTLGGGDTVVDNIPITDLERSVDIYTKIYVDSRFSGEEKWAFWEVQPIGKYGNKSVTVRDSCKVGVPRPSNTITLTVGDIASTRIALFWNRPAIPVDSIRLWYGFSSEVPLHYEIPSHLFGSFTLAGVDTSRLFTGLAPSQTYYFGLQVNKGGLWSYVTEASRVSVTTLDVEDTVTMPNLLRLQSLAFDTATNSVVLQWVVDTTGLALEAGVVWSQDSLGYPMPNPPLVGKVTEIPDPPTSMVYSIPILSTDLRFNSDYYFAVWLRKVNGLWIQPTLASTQKLHIPAAVWESIVYFKNTDTVVALANQIVLRKVEEMLVEAKVRSLGLPVETSGCIPMSIAFRFEQQNAPPLPLYVGLRYWTMPSGNLPGDIRMYHYLSSSNSWVVDTLPSDLDSIAGMYSVLIRASDCVHPFILMIDTVKPDIAVLNDGQEPVLPEQPLSLQIRCSDNIANAKLQLWAGKGDDQFLFTRSEYAGRNVDTVTWSVPGNLVSQDYGLRIITGVADKRFETSINVSRDVVRTISDSVIPGWLQWLPLGSPMVLDNPAISTILREHAGKNSLLRYDKGELRLFRWSANRWEEYWEGGRDLFRLEPTRVVWLKRRLTSPVYYGRGHTSSLRSNSRVTVPPRDWRDFCLPFRFNVRVGDLLLASGQTGETTPLHFYEWRRNTDDAQKRYFAQGVFLPRVPGMNNQTIELTSRNAVMYTVYNESTDTVFMQIPPTPKPLSQITGKKPAPEAWTVALHACDDEGPLNTVYCGFQKGGKGRMVFPSPPSWSDVRAGVYDQVSKMVWGSLIARGGSDSGHIYELVFENTTAVQRRVAYGIERLIESPGNSGIAVIDPETGNLFESLDSLSIVVPPNSRAYRWLAVGSSEYISSLNRLPFRGEFKLMRTMPNPFRQALRIQYEIPYGGIEWLSCTVYDPRGRIAWKLRIGPRIHPGKNEIIWNPRKEKPMAAGTYIIQLSGFDGRNRKMGDRYTRVTYLP